MQVCKYASMHNQTNKHTDKQTTGDCQSGGGVAAAISSKNIFLLLFTRRGKVSVHNFLHPGGVKTGPTGFVKNKQDPNSKKNQHIWTHILVSGDDFMIF